MPNTTVPANATTLFRPLFETCASCGGSRCDPLLDFDADDSGAMTHHVACDAYEAFLVAFQAIVAGPWPWPMARAEVRPA